MNYLLKYKKFESGIYHSDMERLASEYEGDKYEIKIISTIDNRLWYNNLIGSTFVAVKSDELNFSVVPPKLLALFNISIKDYPAYNNKMFMYDSVKYVNVNDCEIIEEL